MSSGISIHCVDVASGRVAMGLRVALHRLDAQDEPTAEPLAHGEVGSTGQLQHPGLSGDSIGAGGYEAVFWVGDYYRAQGVQVPNPAFLERVVYRFHIADPAQHYHLPLKFTAWGYSLFRGGA